MEIRKISSSTSRTSLALALLFAMGTAGAGLSSDTQSKDGLLISQKVADYLSGQEFWGFLPATSGDLKLELFIADHPVIDPPNSSEFDVLAIVPEVNLTLQLKRCEEQPPIFVQGWGASKEAKQQPDEYLRKEVSRFSDFVAHAKKDEILVPITTDPVKLFNADPAIRAERIEQIKSVLSELLPSRPITIRVADFSRLADSIEVLVPSLARMYTMGVLYHCGAKEAVVESRVYRLKIVRPDLRQKIETYSTAEVIR